MKNYRIMIIVVALSLFMLGMSHAAPASCGLVAPSISHLISTYQPWYCPINQQIYSEWASYMPAAFVVVFLSFGIAAVIFMIGVGLNSSRIRNFGIGEFYEAIATTIIIASFLYLCAVLFGILPGVAVGDINPYATAFYLIPKTIAIAQNMYSSLFSIYLQLSYLTSFQVNLQLGGPLGGILATALKFIGFVAQPFINIYTIPVTIYFLDPAVSIAGFLVDGIAALYAEYYILMFFSVAAVPVFLIPGVFFRSFFPTRALGGILIAMAFGFYLIMPALFSVAYYFTAPSIQRDMSVATLQMQRLQLSQQNPTAPGSPLVLQLHNVKSSLNGFWLMIFFYPTLIIAITYTSIVELSNFIGRASRMGDRIRGFV